MKKIRIGNDVIVRVKLSLFNTDDKLKIKQLRCLFVQTNSDVKDNRKVKYYESSDYAYGCCGCPKYNYPICNYCITSHPVTQKCSSNKCELPDKMSKKFEDLYKDAYQADIKIFDDYIEAYMPANDQIAGSYNVIFIAAIYKQGWGTDNIKYATIEEGILFEIVDQNGDGVTKNGVIDLTLEENKELVVEHIIPTSSELFVKNETEYIFGGTDERQNVYNFTFKDDQTDDVYELNEDNIELFTFSINLIDGKNINRVEMLENGNFTVYALDDGYFFIIISSKVDPRIAAKIKCNVQYLPVITEISRSSFDYVNTGVYNLMDREISHCYRYEFKYKTPGSDVFEYITESTAKWFDFELTVDGVSEPNSSVDEFGKLTLLKENIQDGYTRIYARSKLNSNIYNYIGFSTNAIMEPDPDTKYLIETGKSSSIYYNGNTLSLVQDENLGTLEYYIRASTESAKYAYMDKYDINQYVDVTLKINGTFSENKSTIDKNGNITINVDGVSLNTGGLIIATIKDRPDISTYTSFSILQ